MSEYIKIDDLYDTVLRLNNDGWGITRNEHKLISNVLYEMPLYSFPDRKKGEWRAVYQGDEIIDYRCSNCEFGSTFGKGTYNMHFCPNCGTSMKSKNNC